MTWIRCSKRMPMGEACEVRFWAPPVNDSRARFFECANVETLRHAIGHVPDWIDRTEWRPVEEAKGAEDVTEAERLSGLLKVASARARDELLQRMSLKNTEPNGLGKVFGAWPGDESEEELLDALRDMDDPGQSVLRAALAHFGFDRQLKKLGEEACELGADLFRVIGGDDRPGLMEKAIEEMADVSILIKQMKLVYRDEIEAAEARKLARLKERLK